MIWKMHGSFCTPTMFSLQHINVPYSNVLVGVNVRILFDPFVRINRSSTSLASAELLNVHLKQKYFANLHDWISKHQTICAIRIYAQNCMSYIQKMCLWEIGYYLCERSQRNVYSFTRKSKKYEHSYTNLRRILCLFDNNIPLSVLLFLVENRINITTNMSLCMSEN